MLYINTSGKVYRVQFTCCYMMLDFTIALIWQFDLVDVQQSLRAQMFFFSHDNGIVNLHSVLHVVDNQILFLMQRL